MLTLSLTSWDKHTFYSQLDTLSKSRVIFYAIAVWGLGCKCLKFILLINLMFILAEVYVLLNGIDSDSSMLFMKYAQICICYYMCYYMKFKYAQKLTKKKTISGFNIQTYSL